MGLFDKFKKKVKYLKEQYDAIEIDDDIDSDGDNDDFDFDDD